MFNKFSQLHSCKIRSNFYKFYIPIFTAFCAGFIFWFYVSDYNKEYRDFPGFLKINQTQGAISATFDRYFHWSSRLFWEFCVIFFTDKIVIWVLFSAIAVCVMFYAILKITKIKHILLIIPFALLVPVIFDTSAGVYETSINYLWPISICLLGISFLLNYKTCAKWQKVLMYFSFVLACMTEQVSVSLFIITFSLICYKFAKKLEFNKELLFTMTISLIGVLNALFCPGNFERSHCDESALKYEQYTLLGKLTMGFDSTIHVLIANYAYIYIYLLLLIILLIAISKHKFMLFCVMISAFYLAFTVIMVETGRVRNIWWFVNNNYTPSFAGGLSTKTIETATATASFVSIFAQFNVEIISLFYFIGIFALILIISYLLKNPLYLLLFATGFSSRMVLSFSPSVYTSDTRTWSILIICVFFIILQLMKDLAIILKNKENLLVQ